MIIISDSFSQVLRDLLIYKFNLWYSLICVNGKFKKRKLSSIIPQKVSIYSNLLTKEQFYIKDSIRGTGWYMIDEK